MRHYPPTPPREWLYERRNRNDEGTAAEWSRLCGEVVDEEQIRAWRRFYGLFESRASASTRKIAVPSRQWLLDHAHLKWAEIAAAAGLSSPSIAQNWYKQAGIAHQAHGHPDTERLAAIVGTGAAGVAWLEARATVPAVEVATELGCAPGTVDRLYLTYGVTRQRARRGTRHQASGLCTGCDADAPAKWAKRRAQCQALLARRQRPLCERELLDWEQDEQGEERVAV